MDKKEITVDMDEAVSAKMNSLKKMDENEMENSFLIKDEEVKKIVVKHAFCEDCGEELISKAPPMFNPFTLERICKHECSKCGKIYNLEFAYPRLAFYGISDEEIPAYTR